MAQDLGSREWMLACHLLDVKHMANYKIIQKRKAWFTALIFLSELDCAGQ